MKNFFKFLCISSLLLASITYAEQKTDSSFYRAGDTVYISGIIAINPKTGQIISDNIQDQVNQIFKNLSLITKKAGGNLKDIVKLNIYMKNIQKTFPIVKQIIPKYFKAPYPARSPIGGVIIGKNMLLEIDAVMYLPQHHQK